MLIIDTIIGNRDNWQIDLRLIFVIISLEEPREIYMAPILFSESVFELYMDKSLEIDSVNEYFFLISECNSHSSMLMHDFEWKSIKLVSLLINFYKKSLDVFSTVNLEILSHVLD